MKTMRFVRIGPKARASIAAQVEDTRAAVRGRKWALGTERCYCAWVHRYGIWVATAGPEILAVDSTEKVTGFLRSLVCRPAHSQLSATSLKQALNALVFFYAHVRRAPLGRLGDIPRPKRPERLPHVLTREQVRDLIAAVVDSDNYPLRLIARLLYHTGMRIGDVLNLRVQDILGHADVATTMIYTHPSTRGVHVRAAVESLTV